MVQGYRLDPDSRVADEHYAVVYAPPRARDRAPEANVRVVGPVRSSEGLRLFYIVRWLDESSE